MQGSAPFVGGGFGHFYNYAPVKIKYAVDRYAMETKRQLDVLNRRLGGLDGGDGGPYLCGDVYTVADMAAFPVSFFDLCRFVFFVGRIVIF